MHVGSNPILPKFFDFHLTRFEPTFCGKYALSGVCILYGMQSPICAQIFRFSFNEVWTHILWEICPFGRLQPIWVVNFHFSLNKNRAFENFQRLLLYIFGLVVKSSCMQRQDGLYEPSQHTILPYWQPQTPLWCEQQPLCAISPFLIEVELTAPKKIHPANTIHIAKTTIFDIKTSF